MFGLGAAALLASRLLLNVGLVDRLDLEVACSPQVLPGPLDRTSSRDVARGHFSWDNLTRHVEGVVGRREEDEEDRGEAEMVLVGEVATTTSSTELPTGTRPGRANHLISLFELIVMMRIEEAVIIFVKYVRL